jgi:hypothetical protein
MSMLDLFHCSCDDDGVSSYHRHELMNCYLFDQFCLHLQCELHDYDHENEQNSIMVNVFRKPDLIK